MATTTGNIWSSTTEETIADATRRVRIRQFHWVGAVADDTIIVTDGNDRYLWSDKFVAGSVQFPLGMEVDGLKVSTIDGGTLYIYIESSPKVL